jgi:hypothetical protein
MRFAVVQKDQSARALLDLMASGRVDIGQQMTGGGEAAGTGVARARRLPERADGQGRRSERGRRKESDSPP